MLYCFRWNEGGREEGGKTEYRKDQSMEDNEEERMRRKEGEMGGQENTPMASTNLPKAPGWLFCSGWASASHTGK